MFDVSVTDYSSHFRQIKNRKKGFTPFLDSLKNLLTCRIEKIEKD
jgi:hypothetical protein